MKKFGRRAPFDGAEQQRQRRREEEGKVVSFKACRGEG